jgi:hypothetical protein
MWWADAISRSTLVPTTSSIGSGRCVTKTIAYVGQAYLGQSEAKSLVVALFDANSLSIRSRMLLFFERSYFPANVCLLNPVLVDGRSIL